MAVIKKHTEGESATAGVSTAPELHQLLKVAAQGEGALLSGRRERRVLIEGLGFSSLHLRAAVHQRAGSWAELRLGTPFPEGTEVGGLVRSCESTSEGGRGYLTEVELHSVGDDYFDTVARLVGEKMSEDQPRVVYADADPLGRTAIHSALRGDVQLREAATKADILRTFEIEETGPDALVIATRLPDSDSIALARSLYEAGWTVPVILLSSRFKMDAARVAKELAGHPVRLLEKPAGRTQLREELQEALRAGQKQALRKARREARHQLYTRLRNSHRQLRQAVGSYLNQTILEGGAEKSATREISIIFVDIRNSTRLVDSLAPEQAVGIVNRVLSELSEAVETHSGMVDKFLGDGLMGLFGVAGEDPHHRHRALAAARSMIHRIRSLNEKKAFPDGIEVGVGVAIQTGSCILGNVGSDWRREFTALGAPVNVAARLQNLAGPNQIVVSAPLAAELADIAQFDSLGKHELKGFEQPVEVMRVRD